MPKILKKKIVFAPSEKKEIDPFFTMNNLVEKLPKDIILQTVYSYPIGWTVILLDRNLGCIRGINHNARLTLIEATEDALQNSKQTYH